MSRSPVVVVVLVLACLAAAAFANRRLAGTASAGDGRLQTDDGDTVRITPEIRGAGLRFGPEVSSGDREWILAGIARARPEARRLIAEADGMVTITTAGTGTPMGLTEAGPMGFRLWLNVNRLDGTRRIDRDTVLLHEMGHVVDFALIPAAVGRQLDDGIPRGGPCTPQDGVYGNCAPAEERIADTFAKWALDGSVSMVGAGYAIATPPSLDAWGAPLAAIAARLPQRVSPPVGRSSARSRSKRPRCSSPSGTWRYGSWMSSRAPGMPASISRSRSTSAFSSAPNRIARFVIHSQMRNTTTPASAP
jgi:hypothetical protein